MTLTVYIMTTDPDPYLTGPSTITYYKVARWTIHTNYSLDLIEPYGNPSPATVSAEETQVLTTPTATKRLRNEPDKYGPQEKKQRTN